MSRKLDNSLIEALGHGDHEAVYRDISQVLDLTFDGLLELEFLGHGSPLEEGVNFLQDHNAIAIHKLRLLQAFLHARRILIGYMRDPKQYTSSEILKATTVILLMDPEHLTAANARKRILPQDQEDVKEALLKEKYLIDSLLTSHLHRHTKSPTLWSHRRWLILRLREAGYVPDLTLELTYIISISGERHPRNYYAWDHARFLLRAFNPSLSSESGGLLTMLILKTKKWCLHHHNDTSGWSFLGSLLRKHIVMAKSIFMEMCGYVRSYAWRNESVWYFLRNLFPMVTLTDEELGEFHDAFETLASSIAADDEEKRTIMRAKSWIYPATSASEGGQPN